MAMTFHQPDTPILRKYMNDFLTTIRHEHPASHQEFSVLPTRNSSDSYQVDTFKDSPMNDKSLCFEILQQVS
jgi:hypothetical protein